MKRGVANGVEWSIGQDLQVGLDPGDGLGKFFGTQGDKRNTSFPDGRGVA